jgi:hypothetical protein
VSGAILTAAEVAPSRAARTSAKISAPPATSTLRLLARALAVAGRGSTFVAPVRFTRVRPAKRCSPHERAASRRRAASADGAALRAQRRHAAMAAATARALVAAELEGSLPRRLARPAVLRPPANRPRHGAAVPRVARFARPRASSTRAGPRLRGVRARGARRSRARGVSASPSSRSTNSNHFGVAAYHLEPIAAAGLVGLAFGNSPAAMPAWGGKRALFGTNPIAARFRAARAAAVIDLSLSAVARGKIMVAARDGKPIPRLGARQRRQAHHRRARPRSKAACCPPAA